MAEQPPQVLHASPLALAYAQSVLDLANDQQQAESVSEELDRLATIVEENPSFREVLTNPSISPDERQGLLERLFRGNISPLLFNVLGVLNTKNRLGLIEQIAQGYDDLLQRQLGKVEVDLTVAQRLDVDQLEQARQRIAQAIGREPVIYQYVDENIIGGMIIRVGDKLIDASVRNQLASMRQQLLASAPK